MEIYIVDISVRYIIILNGEDSHDADVVTTRTHFKNEDLGLLS